MAIYRFKIMLEDHEDVFREIEIKSTQNFEEFHTTILHAFNFDTIHNASFFISDDYWRKGNEIILREPEQNKKQVSKKQEPAPKSLMAKCKMASLIDDPHQKFVYIYDNAVQWTFLIELMKIVQEDAKTKYPKIAKSFGEAPKQYITNDLAMAELEDDEFDDDINDDDEEAYSSTVSDDDASLLEAEEGEDETEELEEIGEGDELEEPTEFEGNGRFEED